MTKRDRDCIKSKFKSRVGTYYKLPLISHVMRDRKIEIYLDEDMLRIYSTVPDYTMWLRTMRNEFYPSCTYKKVKRKKTIEEGFNYNILEYLSYIK